MLKTEEKAEVTISEHDAKLVDVLYECNCGHTQTIRYWAHETQLPATHCMKCKAGCETKYSYGEMGSMGLGMLPSTGGEELARLVS